MYRVIAKSRGKHNNVVLGARYCFTKRSAANLAAHFHQVECEYTVEKLTRLHSDVFVWTNSSVGSQIWDRMWKILEKENK